MPEIEEIKHHENAASYWLLRETFWSLQRTLRKVLDVQTDITNLYSATAMELDQIAYGEREREGEPPAPMRVAPEQKSALRNAIAEMHLALEKLEQDVTDIPE